MATRYSGFAGRLLDADLTRRTFTVRELDDRLLEDTLGGKVLGVRLLWDEVPAGCDALSPENVLVFTAGPLTGSGAPACSRFNLSTKNVLTGGILSSNCGGDFGIHLKRAGYDALLIRGVADAPVWLDVDPRGARFLDGRHLWGLDVEQVQHGLSPKVGHVVIGPGGENLVRFACLMSGDRCLGRGGSGAVFGSKQLKLVTVHGGRRLSAADPAGFRTVVKKWVGVLRDHSITGRQLPRYGTAGLVTATNATNTLPTRNFQAGHFESADEVSGETLAERHLVRNDGCSSCPIRCGRVVKRGDREIKGPEFETVGMFGPNVANPDLKNIIEWNWISDRLGLDTITLGATLATAMELKQRGRFPELPVDFGRFEGMEKLIEDVAYRRGVGDELAEGSLRMAARHGAPELAMQSKGMEFAAYEPRGAVGHGLGYAVSNRGACHINGGYLVFFEALGPVNIDPLTPKAKPALVVFQQNTMEAVAAAGGCIFTTYAVIPDAPPWAMNPHGWSGRIAGKALELARFLLGGQGRMSPHGMPFHLPLIPHTKAVAAWTGMKFDLGLFTAVGERGYTLERLFNAREGILGEADTLPPRMTDEPQRPREPRSRVPLAEMLPVYYQVRDWNTAGIPSPRLLHKLGLEFALPVAEEATHEPQRLRERKLRREAEEPSVLQAALERSRRWVAEAEAHRGAWKLEALRTRRIARARVVRRSNYEINPGLCRKCGLCAAKCPSGAIEWRREEVARIDPAKCIRCGLCFETCPPHFDAVLEPTSPEDRSGVVYRVLDEKCEKCGICFKKCPVHVIRWKKGEVAVIDQETCVACGTCLAVCPPKFGAIERRPPAAAKE